MNTRVSVSSKGFQLRNLLQKREVSKVLKVSPPPPPPPLFRRLFKRLVIGHPPRIKLASSDEQQKRRKLALSIGSILLILLVVSVGFGWRRRIQLEREEKIASVSQRTDWVMSQAQKLSDVSPARALQLLREEQAEIAKEIDVEPDQSVTSRLKELEDKLRQAESEVGRSVTVAPELYLKLDLIRSNSSGTAMNSAGSNLLVLDTTSQAPPVPLGRTGLVLAISMTDRSGEVVGGGEALTGSRAVTGTAKAGYVLTDKQVIEVILANKTSTPVITDEKEWKDPIKISAFAGNIYLLDRKASELHKYPAIESPPAGGFGSPRRWFAPGITPDLTTAIDLEIDGDVWLLHRDGQVARFHLGAPSKFHLSGLIYQLHQPTALSVPKEGTRVWILDQNRVLAFDRQTGDYTGQWELEAVEKVTDLVVNEELGKIFLLGGDKIYTIKID